MSLKQKKVSSRGVQKRFALSLNPVFNMRIYATNLPVRCTKEVHKPEGLQVDTR
jgi:hypothetical protein